jgi:hypothetical protein
LLYVAVIELDWSKTRNDSNALIRRDPAELRPERVDRRSRARPGRGASVTAPRASQYEQPRSVALISDGEPLGSLPHAPLDAMIGRGRG